MSAEGSHGDKRAIETDFAYHGVRPEVADQTRDKEFILKDLDLVRKTLTELNGRRGMEKIVAEYEALELKLEKELEDSGDKKRYSLQ
ncbi:MAG: hypothetical protein JWN18_606 [Parcubacteria group bacterium]|nr:hypothetical protein [Parcubacteria group bacterium]